ncbi:MAG: beta-lactamase family protein [Holophagales bacterium]|nr:beta-lactamase family protein [Holophagales bacterium]
MGSQRARPICRIVPSASTVRRGRRRGRISLARRDSEGRFPRERRRRSARVNRYRVPRVESAVRRAILLLAAALAARANAGTATPPSSPPIEALHAAAAYSAAREGISFLVLVEGRVVFEDYPNGGAATRPHELASGTKSFSGVMAAAAVKDGLLRLDERVVDSISEWRVDPRKAKVTVRQLLSLTSGVKTGGERGRVPTYADAVAAPLADAPGQRFSYGAVPFQVFGEVMRRKLAPRGEGPLEYLRRRVLDPIGLSAGRWRRGVDGNPHLPSGAALTARDWAKLGELVRLGGRRNGVALLDPEALDACFEGTAANPRYGLSWWLNRPIDRPLALSIPVLRRNAASLWEVPGVPRDLVFAAGAGDQRLYVSRGRSLVVVRQAKGILRALRGERTGFSDAAFLGLLLAPPSGP